MGPGDNELPLDYEPCGSCGFDHEYEPAQAYAEHTRQSAQETVDEPDE